jgi:hypothetical protein
MKQSHEDAPTGPAMAVSRDFHGELIAWPEAVRLAIPFSVPVPAAAHQGGFGAAALQ